MALALVGWIVVLVAARAVGLAYLRTHEVNLAVGAVPFFGRWDLYRSERLVVPAGLALVGVAVLPVAAVRLRWWAVVGATFVSTAVISGALAWAGPGREGWLSVEAGFGRHLDLVSQRGAGGLLRDYVAQQPGLPGHLRAHPPGLLLGLWGLDGLGLRGPGLHLVLTLTACALAAAAALIAFGEVAGEVRARAAAPFLVLAPAAVWHTNPDCIYGALAVSGVALIVVSTGRRGLQRDLLAAAGGLALAAACMASYGATLMALPAVAVVVRRRAWRSFATAAITGVAGLALPALWGFSWPAGLLETRVQYRNSISRLRGYRYWLLGNLAVLATMLGPAVSVGLVRLRAIGGQGAWLISGGLAAVAVAGLSGLTSAETERIWQPFVPVLLLAGAALWSGTSEPRDIDSARRWLALQAAVMVGLQATLRSPW